MGPDDFTRVVFRTGPALADGLHAVTRWACAHIALSPDTDRRALFQPLWRRTNNTPAGRRQHHHSYSLDGVVSNPALRALGPGLHRAALWHELPLLRAHATL